MSDLRPTTKREPCPLCDDVSGKCRIKAGDRFLQCATFADLADRELNGWENRGLCQKNPLWRQFALIDGSASRDNQYWKAEETKKNDEDVPSLEARHQWLSRQLQRPLSEKHKAILTSRGVKDLSPYWSFSDASLAGAFRGVEGGLVGYSLRLDDSSEGGRYRWGKKSRLPSGEMPIAVWETNPESKTLYLIEGLILKPQIASQRFNSTVIGYGGGSGDLSRIKDQLELFCQKFKPTEIRLVPDAGSRSNRSVRSAVESLIKLCQPIAPVRIANWGQWDDKSKGDVDEISDQVFYFQLIRWVEPESFTSRKVVSIAPKNTARNESEKLEIDFKPDLILSEDFYLPKDLPDRIPSTGGVCINGPKASNKSGTARVTISGAKKDGKKIASLHSRLSLVQEQCEKFKIQDVKEVTDFDAIDLTVSGCLDSLLKFSHQKYDLIILDEIRALIEHLALSTTEVGKKRGAIFDAFREMIRDCIKRGGLVIAFDADLTRIEIDFLTEIMGEKPFIVHSTVKPRPREVKHYTGNWQGLFNLILEDVRNKIPIIFLADSQAKIEQITRQLKKEIPWLDESHFRRIDSKTSHLPESKEFLKHANTVTPNLIFLAYSPTISVGLSIEVKHFQKVYAFYQGVIVPTAFRQMLGRERNNLPFFLWTDNKAVDLPYDGETDWEKIAGFIHSNSDIMDQPLVRESMNEVQREMEREGKKWNTAEYFTSLFMKIFSKDNPLNCLIAKIIARNNRERKDYAKRLLLELEQLENCNIETIGELPTQGFKKELKKTKEEISVEEAEIVLQGFKDQSITEEDIYSKSQKGNLDHTTALKYSGRRLAFDLCADRQHFDISLETLTELKQDHDRLLHGLRMRALLTLPEYARAKDQRQIQRALRIAQRDLMSGHDLKLNYQKIDFLRQSGIYELATSGEEFDTNSIQKINDYCSQNSAKLKQIFSVVWNSQRPIRPLKTILAKFCFNVSQSRREKNHRWYAVSALPTEHEKIMIGLIQGNLCKLAKFIEIDRTNPINSIASQCLRTMIELGDYGLLTVDALVSSLFDKFDLSYEHFGSVMQWLATQYELSQQPLQEAITAA